MYTLRLTRQVSIGIDSDLWRSKADKVIAVCIGSQKATNFSLHRSAKMLRSVQKALELRIYNRELVQTDSNKFLGLYAGWN